MGFEGEEEAGKVPVESKDDIAAVSSKIGVIEL